MGHKRKKRDPDDPKPLNFYRDITPDRLKQPFQTPEDERGDSEDDQYYEEEEALSPEEARKRKKEDTFF